MSQAESLRMTAEVQDKFTGPLGALKKQLADLAAAGSGHTDTLEKGFGKLTSGMKAAETAAASGLSPALKTIGITSLTATGAILGVGAALRTFTSGAASLGQMARDTNIAAETLRNFGAVAGKFNVTQEQVASGAQVFADKMRQFSKGQGDLFAWITRQGTTAQSRKHFQDFASDLARTSDMGEKLRKGLMELENIKDPRERRMFAEQFFGNADIGRLGEGHLGKLKDIWNSTAGKLGPLDPKAVESAERFERSLADLGSSMRKLGVTIGAEVLPYAERFTTWLDGIVSDQRGGAINAIRENFAGVKKEIDQINWAQFGADSLAILKETTALAGTLANALHRIAQAMHSLREDRKIEAFRHLDGASGPLARRLAPLPGDDKIEVAEQADVLRGKIGTAKEQGTLQAELLKELEERGDKDGAKRLREAMEANTKHLRSLEEALGRLVGAGGATVQQQSFGGAATIGAMIQKAAYGGGGAGGSGGGMTLGERLFGHPTGSNALGDPGRESRMQAMLADPMTEWRMRIARGEHGVPMPGGGRSGLADIGDGMRGRPFGAPGSGAAVAGRALRGSDGLKGGSAFEGARTANQMEAYKAARAAGLSDLAARVWVANVSGESIDNPADHHWDGKHSATGIVQWDPWRRAQIEKHFGKSIRDMTVSEQTRAGLWEMQSNPRFRRSWDALQNGTDAASMLGTVIQNYESPQDVRAALAHRLKLLNRFDPNAVAGTGEGLRLKSREATAGGPSATGLTSFFRDLQGSNLPGGFDRVTALNDAYHHRANPGSMHTRGLAGDVTLRDPRYSAQAAEAIRDRLRAAGLDPSSYKVMDEYRNPSGHATGGHLHVQFSDREAADRYRAYTEAAQRKQLAEVGDGIKQVRPWQKAPADGGAAFAADFKRRQAEEDDRRSGLKLSPGAQGALQAGAGGQKVEADGKVHINIEQPGPNTKVRSSASGNLFREIVQSRGRQMAKADSG